MIVLRFSNNTEFRLNWPKDRMAEIKQRLSAGRRTDDLISIDDDTGTPAMIFPARVVVQVLFLDDTKSTSIPTVPAPQGAMS